MKKTMFWGAVITPMVLGVYFLVGGYSALAAGPHGHGPGGMGPRGGFGGHQMYSPHHGGFSWIGFLVFLIIGVAILILLVKMLRRKAKTSSMQQLIDTSLIHTHKPVIINQNENMLDQWEKNITNKKENN